MTESNRKPAPHMPDPPVSTALSRASDALTYRITSTIAATLQFLVSTGIKKPWSQRVAKDWDEANLSPQARAFLHLLYMSKSPVKSVQDTRVKTDGLAALVTCNSPYNVERLRIPGSDVPIEIVRSASHPQLQHKGAMLWTHGGAYIAGRAFAYNGPLAEVSSRLGGIDVVLVDYRLAPEADLLEETIGDCLEAYRWCVEKYGAENLVIGGDSAGGGMIANLLGHISHSSLAFPRAAILLSPYIDLSFSYDTIDAFEELDAVVTPAEARSNADHCFNGKSYGPLDIPAMKPVARSKEWPDVLVMTGAHEVLVGDSRNYVKKLKDAGVGVKYVEQDCMSHVYPMFFGWMPEADHAMTFMCQWTRSRIGM